MNEKAFNRFFYISLAVLAAIYCIGMQLPLMDVDSSTYALISKQMFQSGNYLQLYLNGNDYLDKPPLLFWSACLSYKIFGIHDWAYRIPSVLCLALGIYSVYRYAKIFYTERAAKMAALIMASCMACYVMTSDVRADTMLTGWVIFSMWQLAEFNRSLKIKNIFLGGMGVGLAMLTKGPIGLIIPVVAFSVEFAYKRQWKRFFRWQYLLGLLVIALILLPMSYGLYEQFYLHPEKKMYDRLGTSGLRFYYWTQSFGRITGESSWNNNPDPFFLYHSFIWSFAPWCIFFIAALFTEIKEKIINFPKGIPSDKKPDATEAMSVGGFVLILIFLSRSKYQLPHYTFAIHPLAAVLTAKYLDKQFTSEVKSNLFKLFTGIHLFLVTVIFAVVFLIVFYVFPAPAWVSAITAACFLTATGFIFFKKFNFFSKILPVTVLAFATLTFIFNIQFYPNVLKFQTGSYVAGRMNELASNDSKLLIYKDYHGFSMQFYCKIPIVEYLDEQNLNSYLVKDKTYMIADTADIPAIQKVNPDIKVIEKFYNHSPTLLSWKFLNPATRGANVENKVLMRY